MNLQRHALDDDAGDLRPICEPIVAVVEAAARAACYELPMPPRMWRHAREMRANAGLGAISDFLPIRPVRA